MFLQSTYQPTYVLCGTS